MKQMTALSQRKTATSTVFDAPKSVPTCPELVGATEFEEIYVVDLESADTVDRRCGLPRCKVKRIAADLVENIALKDG